MALHLHRARMMNEGSIASILFPDVKKKYKYYYEIYINIFRYAKDYHKENMEKMRKREQDLQ